MTFTASISGTVPTDGTQAGNNAATAGEQAIADALKTTVESANAATPGAVTSATFAGAFVTEDLLAPTPPPPPAVDPALVAIATDLRAQATALDTFNAAQAAQSADLAADAVDLRAVADKLDPPAPAPAGG